MVLRQQPGFQAMFSYSDSLSLGEAGSSDGIPTIAVSITLSSENGRRLALRLDGSGIKSHFDYPATTKLQEVARHDTRSKIS